MGFKIVQIKEQAFLHGEVIVKHLKFRGCVLIASPQEPINNLKKSQNLNKSKIQFSSI